MPDGSATAHLFRPKLATVVAEGYGFASFRRDVLAALTVAIVALPLSMAIAVASGVSPDRGLYASIVGGFLVSALGGSRFQIGGPAGAFIVLVSATSGKFGIDGLLLAVLLSGMMLTLIGLTRAGSLIRHIPHPVTVGFTCGIAITILASQLRDLGGLTLAGAEPGPLLPKLAALAGALTTLNPAALGVGLGSAALIFALRTLAPRLAGHADRGGGRFGSARRCCICRSRRSAAISAASRMVCRCRRVPTITPALLLAILPTALSFTLLGGVESLLSAKVADGMTGRKHRSNMELVAQGVANVVTAFFGGISVTGTIARTATNVRAGAKSPLSGMMHSLFLLLFMAVAAPLASYIPLSALAGVLVVVCWNMAEKEQFLVLLRNPRGAIVLTVTFGLTLVQDLTTGIVAGCIVAAIFAASDRLRERSGRRAR